MAVRTVVVDDSVVVRRSVVNVLGEADDIDVVGTASDGVSGLARIAELRPDVVTLDVEMPGMDGLATLAEIRRQWPDLPVIMYSALTDRGAAATLDALSLGANDYAMKPSQTRDREDAANQIRSNLMPLVRLWGRRRSRVAPVAAPASVTHATPPAAAVRRVASRGVRLVVIGVSTGGPDALARLVPALPANLGVPVLVVQHMPPIFTGMLARRLDGASALAVSEAVADEAALPGHVYIAPGGQHLEVQASQGRLRLAITDAPPENSCRPAVDVLFRSAVTATAGQLLGVVLTGMGQDGLVGSRLVRDAGGTVVIQDEESSVVWGMPGAVSRAGLADLTVPLDRVPAAICEQVRGVVRA